MEILKFSNLKILELWKVQLNFEIQTIERETIFGMLIYDHFPKLLIASVLENNYSWEKHKLHAIGFHT